MPLAADPVVLLYLLVAEVLYVRALRRLAARGVAVGRGQVALWHAGIALWLIAFVGPLDPAAERGLAPHMIQHLLIADLGAPLLLAGLRTPLLQWLLPPAVLVPLARSSGLRSAFRTLRRPLVALPLYVVVLYGWHLAPLFEAAVTTGWVHVLQHVSFVGTGLLVWWAALEPKRRRLRGELWKIGHILGARIMGMSLGMAFVITRGPIYTQAYGSGERAWGLSPTADQALGGALMLGVDFFLVLFALGFFFVRAAQDHDRLAAEAR